MNKLQRLPASWGIGFTLFVANLLFALTEPNPWNTLAAVGLAALLYHDFMSLAVHAREADAYRAAYRKDRAA